MLTVYIWIFNHCKPKSSVNSGTEKQTAEAQNELCVCVCGACARLNGVCVYERQSKQLTYRYI